MPIIKKQFGRWAATPDTYLSVADDAPLPDAPVLISLARLEQAREHLREHAWPVGVLLPSDTPPSALAADLSWLSLVAITFPKFRDGRGYSWARQLRQRFGFRGELRAAGQVLRDQWLFMSRCGFDALAVPDTISLDEVREAMGEQSVFAQPAADGRGRIGRPGLRLMAAAE